jgi:predicted ATPase
VLLTSRAVLHVQGEHEVRVSPLALPSVNNTAFEVLRDSPALTLFSQRARAMEPSFKLSESNISTVAEICTQLDGLPLAIELAAAHIKLLSPSALLARLEQRLPLLTHGPNDLLERHRTLRSTLEWSYELLTPSEQLLFAHLAVFVGGFTLEAAEAVCQLEGHPDVLEGVSSLLDKSLLQRHCVDGEVRFSMLETIREYALEKLKESGEAEFIQTRHTAYFLAFAEAAETHLLGAEEGVWKQRLEHDHDNVRAVLERSLTDPDDTKPGDAEAGLQLAAAFWRFWHVCGHLSEGRSTLARVLAQTSGNTPRRAKALFGAGVLADVGSDHASARVHFLESLAVWQTLGDQQNVARLLNALGMNAWSQAHLSEAQTYFEQSLAICQELGDRHGLPARMNLGLVAYSQGDYALARTFFEESLPYYREKDFLAAVANVLSNLGLVAQAQERYEEAWTFYQQAVTILREECDMECIASQLAASASLVLGRGQWERGVKLFAASTALRERIGAPLRPVERPAYARDIDALRAALGEEAFLRSWTEGKTMTLEQALNDAARDD